MIKINKQLAEFKHFKDKYGCFYENINTNSTFGLKFNFISLARKIFYTFFMV